MIFRIFHITKLVSIDLLLRFVLNGIKNHFAQLFLNIFIIAKPIIQSYWNSSDVNNTNLKGFFFCFFRNGPLVRSVDRDASVTKNTATRVGQRTGSATVTPRGMVSFHAEHMYTDPDLKSALVAIVPIIAPIKSLVYASMRSFNNLRYILHLFISFFTKLFKVL